MAKYYYTANFEDPAVYHHSLQCVNGNGTVVIGRKPSNS
jgi:uncharacterized Fe-S cluster protein YjdI